MLDKMFVYSNCNVFLHLQGDVQNGRGCFEVCGEGLFLLEGRGDGQYLIICYVIDMAAHKTLGECIIESDLNIAQLNVLPVLMFLQDISSLLFLLLSIFFLGGTPTSKCHFLRPSVHPSVHPSVRPSVRPSRTISQEPYII